MLHFILLALNHFIYSIYHLNFVTNSRIIHKNMSEPANDDNFEYLAADDNLYADMQALMNKQLL
jgi:hypothetical protein